MQVLEEIVPAGGDRYDPGLWDVPISVPHPGESAEERLCALRTETAGCRRCGLADHRVRTAAGTGPAGASLMVVGERPGAEEDQKGVPFSGPAGDLLERMLRAIGESRAGVYLTNAVRCRTPEDREPADDELVECRPYLLAEIEAVRPKVVMAAGAVAAHVLLNDDREPIGRLRGRIFRTRSVLVVPTWNPAYLLRRPAAKKDAWTDLKIIRDLLWHGPGPAAAPKGV